jgi:CTP:molybdopterin cytidylyltransferase MocA
VFVTGLVLAAGAAIGSVDPRADGEVLLLGDQPAVRSESVRQLIGAAATAPLGVCRDNYRALLAVDNPAAAEIGS